MSLIVEKIVLEGTTKTPMWAVATRERTLYSVCTSLTFEAHLTAWNPNKLEVEALQRTIDAVKAGGDDNG